MILTKKTLKTEDGDVILERRNSFSDYDSHLFDDRNSTLNSHYSDVNYPPRLGPYYHHHKPTRTNNNFEDMQNLSSNHGDFSTFGSTNTNPRPPINMDNEETQQQNNTHKIMDSHYLAFEESVGLGLVFFLLLINFIFRIITWMHQRVIIVSVKL